jgi:hypothetical protein
MATIGNAVIVGVAVDANGFPSIRRRTPGTRSMSVTPRREADRLGLRRAPDDLDRLAQAGRPVVRDLVDAGRDGDDWP